MRILSGVHRSSSVSSLVKCSYWGKRMLRPNYRGVPWGGHQQSQHGYVALCSHVQMQSESVICCSENAAGQGWRRSCERCAEPPV